MKRVGTIAVCLAGGLVLTTPMRAEEEGLPGNPYAVVVTRNIFGLNPPPVADPNATVVEPPVKIVPNGIMSIFGQLQVLFKVAAKPGGKDASYILMEGQSQDDIAVTKINEKDSIVTFNNHGIVQELPLVATAPSSSPAPAINNGFPAAPGITPGVAPVSGIGINGNNPFTSRFGNRGVRTGGGNNTGGGNDGSNVRPVPTREGITGQNPPMTREEQVVLTEANRLLTQDQVNKGTMPPLPPTEMTPPDATAHNGSPLIVPSASTH